MKLPTSMSDLINPYADNGDKQALRRLWENQARRLMEVEEKRFEPDQISRSKTLEEIRSYCLANIAHIDALLAKTN